jgi:hypothetical protein
MRIRIALIAAMSVAFIMSFMMSFIVFPVVAQAATGSPGGLSNHSADHRLFILTGADRAVGARLGDPGSGFGRRSGARFPSATLTAELPVHSAPATAVVPTPPAPPPPPPPPTDATSTDTADWQCIRVEESGDRYNTPTAPSGAYGILDVTWLSNGYSGWPYQAPAATQDALALKLYNEFGWVPWSSRFACGL